MISLALTEHISDLRRTVILTLLALVLGMLLAIPLTSPFIALLKKPAEDIIHTERIITERAYNNKSTPITIGKHLVQPGRSITYTREEKMPSFVILGPVQGFTLFMKCALFLGALLSSPLWLLSLWRFIAPGLELREKSIAAPFFLLLLLFFLAGAVLGYLFLLPPAVEFLQSFGSELGVNLWSLSSYLEFALMVLFGAGLALELFFFLLLMVHFGVLSYAQLTASRRAVIVLCFILGALLTPPDVLTQVLLAFPLWLLYEACVLYAFLKSN